jgi:hypothetical protein
MKPSDLALVNNEKVQNKYIYLCCKIAGAGAGVQRYNVPGAGVHDYNTAGVQSYNTSGAEKPEFAQQALVVCFC